MMRFFLVLGILFTVHGLLAQDSTCIQRFRTGSFHYKGGANDVTVLRTEKEQIERYNGGRSVLISSIEWPTDSSYRLIIQRRVNAKGCLDIGDTVRTKILHCQKDSIICKTSSAECGGTRSTFIREE
ncbi:MAG: hypothetical protein ABEH38_08945 [Flavobacteriales bacterium]